MNQSEKQKKLYAAVVGYGNRGQVYADYALQCPDEFGVAAVIDVNPFKLSEAKKRYGLKDGQLFASFEDFTASGVKCDFVINSTMDQDHYDVAMKILNAGYDMLMEKPIVAEEEQLRAIQRLAGEKGCKVFVCHVLRYTPFYRRVKEILNSGELGKIMSVEMNEHVGASHYLGSYDRGKWNSEEKCGSSFLLAKCCHDMDILCWLNNASVPVAVQSFGERSQFVKANMPEGASEFCYECKHERTCPYSAIRQYIEMNCLPFLVWDRLNKPLDEITVEEKMEFLKTDVYGRCAYDIAGADLVDRQSVSVRFENGSCASFMLVGGACRADRYLHVVCQWGEIEGKIADDKFTVRRMRLGRPSMTEEVVDVSEEIISKAKFGGHYGGDYAIMKEMIAYLNGDRSSISITALSDSVNGHLCVFAADRSRKNGTVETIIQEK